jgi:hypothetical protein
MKSLSTLTNLYTTLSQNLSSTNQALGIQLMSDQHRYLIQKWFDNERTFQTSTVGGQSLTLTGTLAIGATTATLTAVWSQPTCQQLVSFSNSNSRLVTFTYNNASISWLVGLTATATTAITTTGVQEYSIPANISKITSTFIQVGQLKFVPIFLQTRAEYDRVNFLPYSSDIVNYAYIYNGKLCFFPIPSTTSNVIQFNYKARMPDFSTAFLFSSAAGAAYSAGSTTFDYTVGTVSGSSGSTTISGSTTAWNATGGYPLGVDVTYHNLYFRADPPKGDGIWYPISQFVSDTSLILSLPLLNPITAGATYSIGQMPVLEEDFHDMITLGALIIYYTSIVPDQIRLQQFQSSYNSRLEMLKDYAGTKQVSVDLEETPLLINPNLYPFANP